MQWFKFNWLSIKSKLIVMLLTVSSSSILVTAYLGYRSGQSNLTDRAFSQLTSVRASKAYQIESYFKMIRNHVQTLSNDLSTASAILFDIRDQIFREFAIGEKSCSRFEVCGGYSLIAIGRRDISSSVHP